MLIQDLNYLQTASDNIEGAFASAFSESAAAAAGVNVAITKVLQLDAAESGLIGTKYGAIPFNAAASLSAGSAFAS